MNLKSRAFTTSLIGSFPRSKELLELKNKSLIDESFKQQYEDKLLNETKSVVEMQERVGIDVLVSGELGRDNFVSYIAQKVPGVKLMSMEEIKKLKDKKDNFAKSLEEMDASDNSISNPICFKKIPTDIDLNSKEIERLKKLTKKPFKATIPSPYLLTRSMWLKEKTGAIYRNRKELAKDVVLLLKNEIERLIYLGCKVIQLDEPLLTEIVFQNNNSDTSFYWGALSEKVKVDLELAFAHSLLKEVFEVLKQHENVISAMHVCRGNWTCDESVLLEGAYDKLASFFDDLDVNMLALEFSTPRAGDIKKLFHNNYLDEKIILGYGCINPRNDIVESVEEIVEKVEKLLEFIPPEKIWLNPDCGFATFSNRPLNPYKIIEAKLKNMVLASKILRQKYLK